MLNSSEYTFGIGHLFVYLHFRCTGECILYSNGKNLWNRINLENQPWNWSMRLQILTNSASFDIETDLCEGQCSQSHIGWKDEDVSIVIAGPIARRGRCRWKLDGLGWEEAIVV